MELRTSGGASKPDFSEGTHGEATVAGEHDHLARGVECLHAVPLQRRLVGIRGPRSPGTAPARLLAIGMRQIPRDDEDALSYIDRNLIAGERVVYRTRLHWLVLFMPALLVIVILLPSTWYLAQSEYRSFAWIPALLAVLVLLPAVVKRQSSDFAVTNKRVMMKAGVFTTHSIELLLNKIEAIGVNQTLVGRLFGYGDIVVTGSGGTRESFTHIQGPLQFRRAVQSVSDAGVLSPAA
jgi:membrane protein YdbS with pleckstrin-like domain